MGTGAAPAWEPLVATRKNCRRTRLRALRSSGHTNHLEPLEPRLLFNGAIAGTVFDDVDADGVRGPAEAALAGVNVFLDLDASGTPDDGEPHVLTDAQGRYRFDDVPARAYAVRVELPAGAMLTAPGADLGGTGEVTFEHLIHDGLNGLDGLNGVLAAALSPDGRFVYAASTDGDTVAVLGRDATTGALATAQLIRDGEAGAAFLRGPSAITLSADGAHVYVTSSLDRAVTTFARDANTGALVHVAEVREGIDGVTGLTDPRALDVSPDGRSVYVAAGQNALVVFERDPDTGALTFVQTLTDGVDGVEGLNRPGAVMVSPDGAHVYAVSGQDNAIAVFSRDADTSTLAPVQVVVNDQDGVSGMRGPQHATISPDGRHVYVVANQFGNGLVVFERDAATGALTFLERHLNNQDGITGLDFASRVAVSPDGTGVYALASQFSFALGESASTIPIFERDPATGLLTYQGTITSDDGVDGIDDKRGALFTGDGRSLYIVARGDDALTLFTRTPADNQLAFVASYQDGDGGVNGLGNVQAMVLSPDGRFAYAAAPSEDAVAIFSRDAQSGALTFLQRFRDGFDLPRGLSGALMLELSPDGRHLYVVTGTSDFLTVLARDPVTGLLAAVQTVRDNENGVDGLDQVSSLTISPDGLNVYTTSRLERALSVFARDPASGAVAFLETFRDGDGGITGMATPTDVTVSPDGRRVYVSNRFDDALVVFARDAAAGRLAYDRFHQDPATFQPIAGGIAAPGMNDVMPLVFSHDGRFAVAVGFNTLAVFAYDAAAAELQHLQAPVSGTRLSGGSAQQSAAFSLDGRFLYVANSNNFIAVFGFDPRTGDITFLQRLNSRLGGGQFNRPLNLALSPDGRHLYSVSPEGNEIATLGRDGLPGVHTLQLVDGDDVDGLDFGGHTPSVTVAAGDDSAAEQDADPAVFTVSIPAPLDHDLVVHYDVGGGAANGVDYAEPGGQVVIGAGLTSADIVIVPQEDEEAEGDETVELQLLPSPDGAYRLGGAVVAVATLTDNDASVVIGGRDRARFVDGSGDIVTIALSGPGEGRLFGTSEDGPRDAARLVLTGTTSRSKLAIRTTGRGAFTTLQDIVVDGSLGKFSAKTTHLLGDFDASGFVKALELGNVADRHLIAIGPPDAGRPGDTVTIKLGRVADTVIRSATAIKKLDLIDWLDSDPAVNPDAIEAPWLGKVTVRGDRRSGVEAHLFAGLDLTDATARTTLGGVKAGGTIGGTWLVNGNGGRIDAGAIDAGWHGQFSGEVKGVNVRQDAGGILEALAVGSYAVRGDLTDAQLTVTRPPDDRGRVTALGKLDVRGTAQNVVVRSTGHIGNVSIGLLFDTTLFAGVGPGVTALPANAAQFENGAVIRSLKIKGDRDAPIWLRNSRIAAASVGRITTGFAAPDNSGTPFGIAARSIGSITHQEANDRVRASRAEDIAGLAPLGDFTVRLL